MKKIIIALLAVLALGAGTFLFLNQPQDADQEQTVLMKTKDISREYASLRYRTDNVLIDAEDYADYDAWNKEMSAIIKAWAELEKTASDLATLASETTKEKVSFQLVSPAFAYSKEEITNIIDRAPMGKKIMTLANHLGVDAKKAQLILNQSQDEMSREAYGGEGDVFQTCENRATLIKNGSKVTVFVGTIVITGGTSALAGASGLTKAAVIVNGADLTLEITEDTANIALGNNNKISSIAQGARKITEPVAAILTIATVPAKLVDGVDKFVAAEFAISQFREAAQEGNIVGIKLPVYTKDTNKTSATVSVLGATEVEEWLKEYNVSVKEETIEEIENILMVNQPAASANAPELPAQTEVSETETEIETNIEQSNNDKNSEISGVWKGVLKHTPSQTSSEQQTEFLIDLNDNGTVNNIGNGKEFSTWKKVGTVVKLFAKDGSEGYYEFALSGNTLTFVKLAGPNSEGEWQEDFAGGDFFGGKFYEILLKKQ